MQHIAEKLRFISLLSAQILKELPNMADTNGISRPPAKLEYNGIRVECGADGSMTIFIPPEGFTVTTRAGRNDGRSGRLFGCVVIAPMLEEPGPSAPTQTGLPTK